MRSAAARPPSTASPSPGRWSSTSAPAHRAKTLFATHYHELTELAEHLLPECKNYHVSVKESGDHIIFPAQGGAGSADRSYGIEVARLAGLPIPVIERAREVLTRHEQSEHSVTEEPTRMGGHPVQITIFTPLDSGMATEIARS